MRAELPGTRDFLSDDARHRANTKAETSANTKASATARTLTAADYPALIALLDMHPTQAVFIRGHLDERPNFFVGSAGRSGPRIVGRFEEPTHELLDVCWLGANAVPLGAHNSGKAWAEHMRDTGHKPVSIFGPRNTVMEMWHNYHSTKEPFAIRDNQPLLTLSEPPDNIAPHPDLRLANRTDLPKLFPAAVAMFTEEVGYSPVINGNSSYQERITDRIDRGYSLCAH